MTRFVVPTPRAVLWRYMDFTKYVGLLSAQSLYFPRADTLNDPFEGAKGLLSQKKKWDDHYLEFFRHAIKNPPPGYENTKSDQEVELEAKRLLGEMETGGKIMLTRTFISCWHQNEHESEAMWKLYSNFLDNAIAIKTTFFSLEDSLDAEREIKIGRVKYMDFEKEYAGPNEAFWRKRKSLQHEREVRAIITDFYTKERGLLVKCDLRKLIKSVVVTPTTTDWFFRLVEDVTQNFGFAFKVQKSRLYEPVFY